ncbi:sensor histidine kinase [Paenibacillus silvisoli]|uniref:sensor histidine kinase n=1 Tax=Paenibacillus silvisoli TaxID=3110539 RepID=UPI002803E2A2|nr:sensor histidine kinase [Paenibacillus silvisoli]
MQQRALEVFKSKSIFAKIIVVFMFVITPLCVLSLVINSKGESAVKREIDKSLGARTAYFSNLLAVELNRMIQHQKEFIFDRDLQRLVYLYNTLGKYEWGETILRAQEKMQIIKTSSTYIKNVSAQMLETGKVVSNDNAIGTVDRDAVDAFVKQYHATGSPLMYYKDRLLLGYIYPDAILTQLKPDYVVFIELSVTELRKALATFTKDYEGAGAVLADLQQGWTITNEQDPTFISSMLDNIQVRTDKELPEINRFRSGTTDYLVSYQMDPSTHMALLVYIPEKQVLGDLSSYRIWFWVLSIISMLIIAVFATWIYRLIHKPLTKLVFLFRKVEDGYLEPAALPKGQDEFRYLYEHFNSMVSKLKDLIHKLYEQDLRAKNSELKQLQSQINPHFLYNTYFILHRLAKMNDYESVILFSQYLGEYFQFITRNGASEIPLEQELKHARLYVDIQQIRFSNRIDAEFDPLPDDCKDVLVPKLIVQPIIENAYKYGVERMSDDGLITIRIVSNPETVRIIVEDNGAGMDDTNLQKLQAELGSSMEGEEITGIRNVHRRLQLQFGKESGIVLGHGENGGLKVELVIMRSQAQ